MPAQTALISSVSAKPRVLLRRVFHDGSELTRVDLDEPPQDTDGQTEAQVREKILPRLPQWFENTEAGNPAACFANLPLLLPDTIISLFESSNKGNGPAPEEDSSVPGLGKSFP